MKSAKLTILEKKGCMCVHVYERNGPYRGTFISVWTLMFKEGDKLLVKLIYGFECVMSKFQGLSESLTCSKCDPSFACCILKANTMVFKICSIKKHSGNDLKVK